MPRPICFIIFSICLRICRTWLTCWTLVPLPAAMRARRGPLMISGFRRSSWSRHNDKEEGEMAVRMRLTRVGSKKNPIYRVVVADSRSPRDGKFIEIVGRYNPQTDPSTIEFDEDKVKEWIGKGATPSNTVMRLLKKANVSG